MNWMKNNVCFCISILCFSLHDIYFFLLYKTTTACNDVEGKLSNSFLWLESNLPSLQNGEMDKEQEKLLRVREYVRLLEEELAQQIEANSDLQRDIIKGRTWRDQLCSMMSMIRSETEAVILKE